MVEITLLSTLNVPSGGFGLTWLRPESVLLGERCYSAQVIEFHER